MLEKPFKRISISNEEYLKTLVLYIHLNPEKHQIHKNFSNYKYSSYKSITSEGNTNIQREEVISWFDDLSNFKETHQQRKIQLNLENEKLFLE